MSFTKSLTLGIVLCLVTFCYVSPTTALAQTNQPSELAQGDHDQTLRQLLTEVRELRLAVQRATVNNSRFQMLIERNELNRQLEALMSELKGP
jgi:hypothetical protein